MKKEYLLILPVDKFIELEDKDLEEINFRGGIVCFKSYISKMIENKYKTDNSKVEVKSIEWREGRNVLYVKFTQTYFFDHDPVYNAACEFLKGRGFEDFEIGIQYNHYLGKIMFYVNVKSDETNSSVIEKKLKKADFNKAIKAVEPDIICGVHYTITHPISRQETYSF
ncbi:MAG: hypothetical protein MJ246_03195 [Clostridia bacterium]|nr:hypothetical protein [Clostridia bacterium]